MFVTCDRERLLSTFSIAAKLATAKPVHEIFRYACVQANPPNKLVIQAGDGTTFLVRTISGVNANQPGSTLLPLKSVAKLLRETKQARITLSSSNGQTLLETQSSQHSLPNDVDVAAFPLFSEASAEALGTRIVKAQDLARLLRRTAFAPIPLRGRPTTLDVVRLEFTQDTITAIATNRHRMAIQTIPVQDSQGEPNLKPVQLPMKSAQDILSTLTRQNGNVKISRSEYGAVFRFTPASKLPDADKDELTVGAPDYLGTFPDWSTIVPKSSPAWTSTIPTGGFLGAVKQATLFTPKDGHVTLALSEGQVKVSIPSTNGSDNAGTSILAASSVSARNSKVSVAVKAKYLADFLRALDPKTPVTLQVRAHLLPVVLTTPDNCTYLVAQVAS